MNSLNYIAGLLGASFSKSNLFPERGLLTSEGIGVAWGFQRNYPKRFSLDFKLGVGYGFTDEIIVNETAQYELINKRGFIPVTNLTLGFWLNRKHK